MGRKEGERRQWNVRYSSLATEIGGRKFGVLPPASIRGTGVIGPGAYSGLLNYDNVGYSASHCSDKSHSRFHVLLAFCSLLTCPVFCFDVYKVQ